MRLKRQVLLLAFALAFTVVSVLFAVLLSLSTGTLNARDADLASVMLVQLVDRLGQGFRRNCPRSSGRNHRTT